MAAQTLLNSSPKDWGWRDLVAPVPANFAGSKTMEEVVVTNRVALRFVLSSTERSRIVYHPHFERALLSEVSKVTDLRIEV